MSTTANSKGYSNPRSRLYIRTFGCQMNVRDSEVVCGLLKKAGYVLSDSCEEADIVIFNTCSVRQHAEEKVWSEIGRIAKLSRRPKRIVGLIGCMAQNYKEHIFERSPQVDFAVGPADIGKMPEIIEKVASFRFQVSSKGLYEAKVWETEGEARPEEIYHTGFYGDKEHAYVVISEGCSNFCSYCVVPYVRGGLRNRNVEDILREIKEAIDKGITRVTLLGQNVNAYQHGGVDFIKLLRLIDALAGLKEFSFVTSHPKDTSLGLFEAMQECVKLNKYLHLPVQSGSDRILKLMNRGYDRNKYLALADAYRKTVKGGLLTTDIIVGFPYESEADFHQTRDLLQEIQFDAAFIFKYSVRPNTQAATFMDDVPLKEKQRRHALILELQKKISKKTKQSRHENK